MEFFDWVDRSKGDFHMKDAWGTSRLSIVPTGPGRLWFIDLRGGRPTHLERIEISYDH